MWSALYWTWQPTCTTAVSSSYYEILHIACMLYCMFLFYLFIFFIVETLCMYLAWFPFHSFNPVNNKFLSLNCFVFFYDHSGELTATFLHYEYLCNKQRVLYRKLPWVCAQLVCVSKNNLCCSWKNSADDKLMIFFFFFLSFFFPIQQLFSCKFSQVCMQCQNLASWGYKKKIFQKVVC